MRPNTETSRISAGGVLSLLTTFSIKEPTPNVVFILFDKTLSFIQAVVLTWFSGCPKTLEKEGWQQFNGHCYKLFPGKVTWEKAAEICKSIPGVRCKQILLPSTRIM